jgi:DNA-binding IclR family transcriptional regulator
METFTPGLNAMAAPVRLNGQAPIGVISIAGPTVRFSEEKMHGLAPDLLSIAAQIAAASGASPFFSKRQSAAGLQPVAQPIYAA